MFTNNIDPILIDFGRFNISYYGLFYGIGFLFSYFFIRYLIKKKKDTNLETKDVDDFFLFLMIGGLLGARIFYVLIYNFNYYMQNPQLILAFNQGGMSFHGSWVGAMLALGLYVNLHSKKKKDKPIEIYDITDLAVIPFALSLSLGRIGNFTNHELYGRVTDVAWAVKFRGVEGYRHPSQIYSSIKNILIFGILFWINTMKGIPKGIMTWSFITLYGILRFFVEFFRQPDSQLGANGFFFGWISMGQILSSIMIVFGIGMLFYIYYKDGKRLEE